MTAPTAPPVYEMRVMALAPPDVWTLHVDDGGRRLSIAPESVEVSMWKPNKAADARYHVAVRGRLVRQADGLVTGIRRIASFRFDEDEQSGWNTRKLSETPSLDPELREFALEARRRIEAAIALAVAS